jgi:ribonuclease BN (tRNA processing enzyme)
MLLTSLGIAGWMPSNGHETSTFLVRSFDRALLLDAGTGVRRLITNPSLLQDIRRVMSLGSHISMP